jgi:methionyl-tRNA formyltransferase
MTLRFAFLVLKEHPYGREMLRILLDEGLVPSLIIEEDSPVAEEEREKFLTRIAGQPVPPTVADLTAGTGIPSVSVDNHNRYNCRQALEAFRPELLVLGGTRILGLHILQIPVRGTLNAHPGLLPWLRGSSSVAWALYKDMQVGSTVHFVDKRIDTGPIIIRTHLPVHRGATYEQIVRVVLTVSGVLMAEALRKLSEGDVETIRQDPSEGETLRVIPPELLAQAKARLVEETYSHFID